MKPHRDAIPPAAAILLLAAALLVVASSAAAQQQAAPAPAPEQPPAPVTRAAGDYVGIASLIVSLVLFGLWLWATNWAAADIRRLRLESGIWGGLIIGGGLVGFLLMLVLPWFILGLLVALLCAGGSLAAYVCFRNTRVPATRRINVDTVRALLARRGQTRRDEADVQWTGKVLFLDESDRVRKIEPADEEQRLGYPLACRLLSDTIWRRASDVYLLPAGEQTVVRVRIDGVLTEQPPLPRLDGERIICFLKATCGLDAANRRRPQAGNCRIHLQEKTVELRVRTAGTTEGERFEARVLEPGAAIRLGNLGFTEAMLADCQKMIKLRRGLIVVAGPAGSGVTTTLYAMVKEHDAFQFNIHSLENPKLLDLDNVTQEDFNDQGATVTFARQLQSIIRRDPDIVLLGGVPDADTARLAIDAVKGGKKILAGLDAEDTFDALDRLVALAGEPALVADALVAILAQRLLRTLCPHCRQAYQPPPELLAKINLQADRFYRPTGKVLDDNSNRVDCPHCQGTGYVGRTAVYELMVLSAGLRDLLRSGATGKQFKDECRRGQMLYLQENAMAKVVEGVTSIKEVMRATQKRSQNAAR
jgi:type II secretory ATPase GspE/PulE/Tfp pilus assembly ATPase PilB-like protein